MTRQQLSEEIKWKRKQLGESQRVFAKRFGMSASSISRLEPGRYQYTGKGSVEISYISIPLLLFVHDCNYELRSGFRIKKRDKSKSG
jgi:transcriptional regulator with XRE-family HTH domain